MTNESKPIPLKVLSVQIVTQYLKHSNRSIKHYHYEDIAMSSVHLTKEQLNLIEESFVPPLGQCPSIILAFCVSGGDNPLLP